MLFDKKSELINFVLFFSNQTSTDAVRLIRFQIGLNCTVFSHLRRYPKIYFFPFINRDYRKQIFRVYSGTKGVLFVFPVHFTQKDNGVTWAFNLE